MELAAGLQAGEPAQDLGGHGQTIHMSCSSVCCLPSSCFICSSTTNRGWALCPKSSLKIPGEGPDGHLGGASTPGLGRQAQVRTWQEERQRQLGKAGVWGFFSGDRK